MDSTRGQLLIAGPGLLDANFFRTVVLVIAHSEEGALGLILNRPSDTTVGKAVTELDELIEADDSVYVGGPVAPSALIVLAEFDDAESAALISFADVGVLASGAVEDGPPAVRRGRAFVGHAGWGPGQLEDELERGDWILEAAVPEDAFTTAPADLWGAVLIRKGGRYALLARMPPDPSVN